ncbi:PREDICTED: LYR motif-containing protein 4-like [Camelina sativa]|uniref:LYR motif-containing protein 4-like n=1 Tax=Camelina sativa TaxID=90675 RepID=A0ABM1QP16_CAMSA|nr:PREDICTED: LYR motif-containing protein 4-like [Camelina sativa]
MVSRSEVLSLCRAMLRAGRQYPHYNLREYTKRRTLDGFRMNKNLTDQSKVNEAYAEAKAQLVVLERSVKFHSLYPPKTKNIMEVKLQ